jgi:arylsulfatase A-like enzyme
MLHHDNLMKCRVILISALALFAFPMARILATEPKPNVLFIALDDLRPELGCYGQSHIVSPNIDKLAAQGTVFLRAYCQQAVCNPSRASLMTGLRPDSTGVYNNNTHFRAKAPDVVTLPQQFKEHGYHTQAFGKLYHGAFEKAYVGRAYDDERSWIGPHWYGSPQYYFTPHGIEVARQVYARKFKKPTAGPDEWKAEFVQALATEAPEVPDNALYDGEMTDQAIKTLGELKGKQFFLAVGYLKPHLPFVAPKKYWDLYDPAKVRLADNNHPPKDSPAVALHSMGELRVYSDMPKQGPVSDEQARRLRHGYYACVSFVDAQIGRLLAELDRLGLHENTIVVLWGDHGWHLGEHALWTKQTNFEVATRAPLIVSAPRAKATGQKLNALVEFVDIYPTLCELAGLPLPKHLEGSSFAPLLNDPNRAWKPAAFSQFPRPGLMGYSMRTDRHRLTLWQSGKDPAKVAAVELYDHQTDPSENTNLAAAPEHASLVKELTDQLRRGWQAAKP